MRKSAFISIALHLAILLWVLVVFPSGRALDAPKIEDVPIDIVTPSEFTKIKAGMVDDKDEAPLAPKPEEPFAVFSFTCVSAGCVTVDGAADTSLRVRVCTDKASSLMKTMQVLIVQAGGGWQ